MTSRVNVNKPETSEKVTQNDSSSQLSNHAYDGDTSFCPLIGMTQKKLWYTRKILSQTCSLPGNSLANGKASNL